MEIDVKNWDYDSSGLCPKCRNRGIYSKTAKEIRLNKNDIAIPLIEFWVCIRCNHSGVVFNSWDKLSRPIPEWDDVEFIYCVEDE